jgi:hypothetical protein
MLACRGSARVNAQPQGKTAFEFVETADAALRRTMQNNANAVFDAIHSAYSSERNILTISKDHAIEDAIEQIQALWSTSHFYYKKPDTTGKSGDSGASAAYRVLKSAKGYQVRNIPVFFKQGETKEEQNQDIAIEFTPQGRISDVYIAIPMHQYLRILGTGNTVTDLRRRQKILEFLDNYRTSYYRKDIEYIKQVFSEDVLIITGRKLEKSGDRLDNYEYIQQNKDEYITRLEGVFKRNSYISVKLDSIEVNTPYKDPAIYTVSLRQEWNSSYYSDAGWLFLIIDFKYENRPMIWVRAWDRPDVPRNRRICGADFFWSNQ